MPEPGGALPEGLVGGTITTMSSGSYQRVPTLRLPVWADLTDLVADDELTNVNIGPDGQVYVLIEQHHGRPQGPIAGRTSFPPGAHDYRVLALTDGAPTLDLTIRGEEYGIHHLQPLPDGELLLDVHAIARRDSLFLQSGHRLYHLDVATALASLDSDDGGRGAR